MTSISVERAQQELPNLIERVLAGEEIVIETGHHVVRLVPEPAEQSAGFNEANARRRGFGILKGQLVVGPEFFDPLSDEECDLGGHETSGS